MGYLDRIKVIETQFKEAFPDKDLQQKRMVSSLLDTYFKKESFPLYIKNATPAFIQSVFSSIKQEHDNFFKRIIEKDENVATFSGQFVFNVFDMDRMAINNDEIIKLARRDTLYEYETIREMLNDSGYLCKTEHFKAYKNQLCDLNQIHDSSVVKYQLKYATEAILNKDNCLIQLNDSIFMHNNVFNAVIEKAKSVCDNFGFRFISIENRYLISKEKAINRLTQIEKMLFKFCERAKIKHKNAGMDKLGLIFRESNHLNKEIPSPAGFITCSENNINMLGAIVMYSDEDKSEITNNDLMKIEHEYLHALDFSLSIQPNKVPFTQLTLEEKEQKKNIFDKIQQLIYLISDNKQRPDEKTLKSKLHKYLGNIFSHLTENCDDNTIIEIKNKTTIMKFVEKYLSFYIERGKKKLQKIWSDTLNYFSIEIKPCSFKSNLKIILNKAVLKTDMAFNAYYEKPTNFINKIMLFSPEEIAYFKSPKERLAWVSLFAEHDVVRTNLTQFYSMVHGEN